MSDDLEDSMTFAENKDGRYVVSTDTHGTIWFTTDDRSAAFREAADINSPDFVQRMQAFHPQFETPGTARVYENTDRDGLVEITDQDES